MASESRKSAKLFPKGNGTKPSLPRKATKPLSKSSRGRPSSKGNSKKPSPKSKSNIELTRQIEIVHLSDIHFGTDHRYQAPRTAGGDRGAREGIPTLATLLERDFTSAKSEAPVIICITGDITTTASYKEFLEAETFLSALTKHSCFGSPQSKSSIFMVPGNHDVSYEGEDVAKRWQQWMEFANRFYGTNYKREDPWAFTTAHDLIDKLGIVVLTLNSCIWVQKDTEGEQRGEIDEKQLLKIKKDLDKIPTEKLRSAIRIALIHHHPILIPSLVESNRGYDAVVRSEKLLTILHDYGFHILLHGHKHYPLTFLEKTNSAFIDVDDQPLMVVAGGSAGSTGLPDYRRKTNCYNRIVVKWHPSATQARIRVETKGLVLYEGERELLSGEWHWETLHVDDKSFYAGDPLPAPMLERLERTDYNQSVIGKGQNAERVAIYAETRGNLPVVEVMPSLEFGQAYEARFWIVPHAGREKEDIPIEVHWSAGPRFPVLTVREKDDPEFCGVFNYWGPMLIQAHIVFRKGKSANAYVYARIPTNYNR